MLFIHINLATLLLKASR